MQETWYIGRLPWVKFIVYTSFIAGQGGHFADGSRKPVSSSPASSSAGRQPLKAIHSFLTPSHIGSLSSSSKEIRFYNQDEPYYEFTNFYRAPIQVDGYKWPTSEHYFQAQKFVGTPYVDVIRKLPSARDAFQFSRDPRVSRWCRSDWESVKDNVMLKALHMKFRQHEKLRRKLLETGEKKLVEHTSNDSYWGDGGDGSGRNTLGKLLMQLRKGLRAKYGSAPSVVAPRSSSLRRSGSFSGSISSHYSHFSALDSAPLSSALTAPLSSRKRSASHSNLTNIGSTLGPSLSRPSASELGYHTTSHHTSYQPQSNNSRIKKDASTSPKCYASSFRSSRPFSHVNDDSALLFHTPPVTLSSRKRSASYSNLTNTGSAAGQSYSVSELDYASSETWKKGATGSHTTSLHTSYQPQSSNSKKNKGTSLSQYSKQSTSSKYHPKLSTSLLSSSTSSHYQPSFSKPSITSTFKPSPRTVHALASPMVSHTTYKRALPPDPPTPSSSSLASTGRRHTNQSSVDYDILTGRRNS